MENYPDAHAGPLVCSVHIILRAIVFIFAKRPTNVLLHALQKKKKKERLFYSLHFLHISEPTFSSLYLSKGVESGLLPDFFWTLLPSIYTFTSVQHVNTFTTSGVEP